MDAMSFEEMHTCLLRLIEIAKCAICLEKVRPEIKQCVNGHIFCSECLKSLNSCPTCRQHLSESPVPIIISQFVEGLPVQCKDSKQFLRTIDNHTLFCDYKQSRCKLGDCKWEGPEKSILKHLEQQHGEVPILSENCNLFIENLQPDTELSYFSPFLAKGIFFWLGVKIKQNKNMIYLSFCYVPFSNIKYQITLKTVCCKDGVEKFPVEKTLVLDPQIGMVEENVIFVQSDLFEDFNIALTFFINTIHVDF